MNEIPVCIGYTRGFRAAIRGGIYKVGDSYLRSTILRDC